MPLPLLLGGWLASTAAPRPLALKWTKPAVSHHPASRKSESQVHSRHVSRTVWHGSQHPTWTPSVTSGVWQRRMQLPGGVSLSLFRLHGTLPLPLDSIDVEKVKSGSSVAPSLLRPAASYERKLSSFAKRRSTSKARPAANWLRFSVCAGGRGRCECAPASMSRHGASRHLPQSSVDMAATLLETAWLLG